MSIMWYYNLITDDVINNTTNILCEMNFNITHVLSFHAVYDISIISLSFLVIATYIYCRSNKNRFYCYSFNSNNYLF